MVLVLRHSNENHSNRPYFTLHGLNLTLCVCTSLKAHVQNLKNTRFASKSYLSHGKSFSHVRTNFRFEMSCFQIIAFSLERGSFSCLNDFTPVQMTQSSAQEGGETVSPMTQILLMWTAQVASLVFLSFTKRSLTGITRSSILCGRTGSNLKKMLEKDYLGIRNVLTFFF